MQLYSEDFYKTLQKGARQSAREIIPILLEFVQPRSVIDVGCGIGTWLSAFAEYGIEDFVGIDGEYVDRNMLEIPYERFLTCDLSKPVLMDRTFDLVVSLEVGEHLPEECAEQFVDSLTRLGPIILFSAAIPFQGGANHVNEQWPEYWTKYFQEKKYQVIDCIRKRIWQNENVEWWYAQNILLFVKSAHLETNPLLKRELEHTRTSQLSLIHPGNYLRVFWMQRIHLARQDIAALIPPDEIFILVDQGQFGSEVSTGYRAIPFLERDGNYWGPPPDDATAIRELERLRGSGAHFMVFGWPAFWWLDYYSSLYRYVRSEFRCLINNDRLIIYDLRK